MAYRSLSRSRCLDGFHSINRGLSDNQLNHFLYCRSWKRVQFVNPVTKHAPSGAIIDNPIRGVCRNREFGVVSTKPLREVSERRENELSLRLILMPALPVASQVSGPACANDAYQLSVKLL